MRARPPRWEQKERRPDERVESQSAPPLPLPAVLALQRTAGNQAVGRMLQRRMTFSPATAYLDTEQGAGPFPGIYQAVQARTKQLVRNVEVCELTDPNAPERAHYKFEPDRNRASINVRPRMFAGAGGTREQQELSDMLIALVHETQHALDDLEDTSALKNKVADHGGGPLAQEDAQLGPVMEKMWSELNAHAVQAAQARELRANGRPIRHTDALLADTFTLTSFEPPTGAMFKKLVSYAKLYTGGKVDALAEQQVIEMLCLSWGEVEALVAKSHRAPGRIGINDPGDLPERRVESDEEDVEEIIVA